MKAELRVLSVSAVLWFWRVSFGGPWMQLHGTRGDKGLTMRGFRWTERL